MAYRLAKSLETLRNQVNAAYPTRSKVSDGWIGDAAHKASASDHNPNRNGVVCALDLTHDPKSGFDAHALADHLRKNRHPNLRYVISNARIAGWWTNWEWQPSVGHTQHVHISVGTLGVGDGQTYDRYDSTNKWNINYGGKSIVATIKNASNWRWRFNRLHRQLVRNADMSDAVFKGIVGKDAWGVVESWSDHPEANRLIEWQVVGEKATKDDWAGQIKRLQEQVKSLGSRPTQSDLDKVKAEAAKLSSELNVAKAEAVEARRQFEESEADRQATVEEANGFIAAVVNAVRKLLGKE